MLNLNWDMLFVAINLIIFYMVIKRFLLKPVNDIIEKRNNAINAKFNEAETAKKDAYSLKAKYEDSLKGANAEREQILDTAREDAKTEYDRILEEAENKAEGLIASAKVQAEEEHRRIIRESDAEMAKLVMEATRKVVLAGTNEESNRQIYDNFLTKEGEADEA